MGTLRSVKVDQDVDHKIFSLLTFPVRAVLSSTEWNTLTLVRQLCCQVYSLLYKWTTQGYWNKKLKTLQHPLFDELQLRK